MNRLSSLQVTAATQSLAVVAAGFLVFGSPPHAHPLASQEITMPTIRQLFQQMSQHLRQMRLERQTVETLHQLDTRTLADIGLHPSEIASVCAEWRGQSPLSRLRIVRSEHHA
jgi:uncharacterized protein YjiS (DUF1127 family)